MVSTNDLLKDIIKESRIIESQLPKLSEFKDRLRNENFHINTVLEMEGIARTISLELSRIRSEMEESIKREAKTNRFSGFRNYSVNEARIIAFGLFIRECENYKKGKTSEANLMSGLERVLRTEAEAQARMEEGISLYERTLRLGRNAVASAALVGTLLGGFVGADFARPKSSYGAEASVPEVNPIKENGHFPLPSLDGWKYLGEMEKDYSDIAPGKEIVRGYEKGNTRLIIVYFRGKENPYMYWYVDKRTGRSYGNRLDANNDGDFEYRLNGTGGFFKFEEPSETKENWNL